MIEKNWKPSLVVEYGEDTFLCFSDRDMPVPDNEHWAIRWIRVSGDITEDLWYKDKTCHHKIDTGSGVKNTLISYASQTLAWKNLL